jgi:hypothetical protein
MKRDVISQENAPVPPHWEYLAAVHPVGEEPGVELEDELGEVEEPVVTETL